MLARPFKIGNKSRIEYILKKGIYFNSRLLRFKYLRNNISHSRFSTVVSPKISKKAVERNKIRRRIYEAIRVNWHAMPKTCYDLVVLASQRIVQATFQDIERDLIFSLKKL